MSLDIQSVRTHFPNRNLHHFDTLDTTMREAAARAARGAAPGTTVIAEEQTAGQGRHGHSWHSEKGRGLYLSVLLNAKQGAAPTLTLALGLATAEAITTATTLSCDLRWPNDVMVNGKKAAGILTHLSDATAIAGIGINVNQATFPVELQRTATSLRLATGTEWSRVELAAALLKSLHREYRNFLQKPNAHDSILRRFAEHSSYARGRQVRVEENGGFEGITEGLDQRGFLQVRTPQGLRLVFSGTVRAARDQKTV